LTKISDIQDRIDRLGQESSLSTEEANFIRGFWIQLNYSPQEQEEYSKLKERQDVLYANWLARRNGGMQDPRPMMMSTEEAEEWTMNIARSTQISHDIVMQRVIANHALRDQVWPELAPRVLRWRKLAEKPSEGLTGDEKRELETLENWFTKLQREALGEASKES